ncbi:hypothetical protein [Erwinia mallotivora]|uniref:hypothetical protein n=1 Tax=Erwinia mallotivora TaxID=69222 RepID=UPI0021BF4911|nr:hypothetical protein [Erwinia mallotivora]
MVNIKIALIFFFTFSSRFACSDVVTDIEINESGIAYIGHSKVEQEGCKLFRPTPEQLAEYFNQAQRLEFGGWREHTYYSPCIVTGKVSFKSGQSGKFTIQSSGYGYGTFNNKAINFFHKENPWFDPFQCSYAMGDEPDPGCDDPQP